MSDVFISHVEEDKDVALEIARGLNGAGYTTWCYEEDNDPGVSYLTQIGAAIEACHAVVLVISPESLGSDQVTREVEFSHDSRKRFVPVLKGISHVELQNRRATWRVALGTASSIPIPPEGVSAILPRIVRGLQGLGVNPTERERAEAECMARDRAEAGRKAPEKAEQEERENAEAVRKAEEKAEQERRGREKADSEARALAQLPAGAVRDSGRAVSAMPSSPPTAVGTSAVGTPPLQGESSDSQIIAGLAKRHKKAVIGSAAAVAALVALTWFLLRRPRNPSAESTEKPSAELTQKQLTFNSGKNALSNAVISPDGNYIAYSDPAGIHVKLLSTSEDRLISRPADVPASTFWEPDSWFPDGTQLLADAYEPGGRKSIWTVSVLGQSPRELREDALGLGVAPDGTHIAFSPRGATDDVREIWVMGIQGDNPQKVFAVGENETLDYVHWSPDGHRCAYARRQRAGETYHCSIETCDLKGANRTVVVSADPGLSLGDSCWLPDGRIAYELVEWSNPSDYNLWGIPVDNNTGTPTGKPKRITQWAGSYVYGFSASADGKRLVLMKGTYQAQVDLGELAAGGSRMKPPRRLTNEDADDNPSAWTADSRAVLFRSFRAGAWGIFKQEINQETSEVVVTGPQFFGEPRLSADGAWILFLERPKTPVNPAPPWRLMRVPASGGLPQFVLEARYPLQASCARAPASLCVIQENSQDLKQILYTAFDPLKGRGKVLRTIQDDPSHTYGGGGLSPDGSTVAISRELEPEVHIRLLSLSGGSDSEITVKGWSNLTGLDWAPDGKGLYVGANSAQGRTLLYADLKGNARVLWQYKGVGYGIWGIPSPDGRYLATVGNVVNGNAWMVEGF